MLISCKCLNFIATSPQQQQQQYQHHHQQQQQQQQLPAALTSASSTHLKNTAAATADATAANTFGVCNTATTNIAATLMQIFLQKYPRNFIFYSQCMDFFKQAIGPIPDLTINAINQRDLIYSLTLDVPGQQLGTPGQPGQTWQLSFCINCNATLCAKRLQCQPAQFLINYALVTSNEELVQRRADKSFSETFGLLIMDHPELDENGIAAINASSSNLSIGSLSATLAPLDVKQQRLRQLQTQQQTRLKREIAETDERIQRYTEQQFALLRSFREKSDQEYALLARLIQQVPDEQANGGEWLDRMLPTLEVNGGAINYTSAAARRRNTISSRRELMNGANGVAGTVPPLTPTLIQAQPPNFLALPANVSNSNNGGVATSAIETKPQPNYVVTSGVARKMSSFDTPPATPEATPMSVGNSPTFRPQQQPNNQQGGQQQNFNRFASITNSAQTATFQQQFPTPTADAADDCLFDLEDVETPVAAAPMLHHTSIRHNFQQSAMSLPHYQRLHSQHESQMSDLDESDAAEEAEDALDLDSSMPINMRAGAAGHRTNPAQILNFAKSLPIEIANSPLAERTFVPEDAEVDDLDNAVDIAASIKALAKSVHGEAVFGDLPRPRLRSQI